MRVVTTLFWYDEPPGELYSSAIALTGFADRLVAINGRWKDPDGLEFPQAEPDRFGEELEALVAGTAEAGIDLTVHRPAGTFVGEIAQRNYALQHALIDADWIFLMDADERVVRHEQVRETLDTMKEDVGTVDFYTLEGPEVPATTWEVPGVVSFQRRVFRANPGLRFEIHHWWLVDDRRSYWGDCGHGKRFAKAHRLEMMVEHRTSIRTPERWAKKREFIAARDPADIARGYEH